MVDRWRRSSFYTLEKDKRKREREIYNRISIVSRIRERMKTRLVGNMWLDEPGTLLRIWIYRIISNENKFLVFLSSSLAVTRPGMYISFENASISLLRTMFTSKKRIEVQNKDFILVKTYFNVEFCVRPFRNLDQSVCSIRIAYLYFMNIG